MSNGSNLKGIFLNKNLEYSSWYNNFYIRNNIFWGLCSFYNDCRDTYSCVNMKDPAGRFSANSIAWKRGLNEKR